MKFFIDLSKKQLIKSAASNVALDRLVLKRRDSLAVEVVFVSRNAVASMPVGTTVSVALKKSFADSNFLASASGTPPILNLNTVPLEALFTATAPSAIPALLEIRWTVPGETTRTATLTAEVQNSVILGTEGTPEAIPDGKATQAQAEAGTDNTKWMTPLRTAQAIAVLAPPPTWDAVLNKPATFPPSAHTHTASQITDFATAVVAAAPPTTNASLLTSGTLADARLSATAAVSLAKADTASQPGHTHATSDISSASVYFDIADSHPSVNGSYDVWDIDANGRFRWANQNAAAEGDIWTALRWNANRWELGTYTAFTTWTALYFNPSTAVIPPATDWQAVPGNTQPIPTLQWFSQPTADEITSLHAEDSRLQKQLDEQGGINTAAIQTLSTETAAALTLKADLVNGLVPTTQLPPLSFQTTRYDGDDIAFTFAPPGTLTNSDSPSAISVTINGVTQDPGSDYTLNVATNRVVLTSALPLGDKIVITRPIVLPSNSTLTAEQLGALTATSVIDGGSF